MKVPEEVWQNLQAYWLKYNDEMHVESEYEGASINYWDERTYMVNVHGRNESHMIVHQVFEMMKQQLEAWTSIELRPISLYGIRVYPRGAILAPHVDNYPLITSAIINVDQEVDEPWPLE